MKTPARVFYSLLLSTAALAASAFFASAHADDCGPLKQLMSLDLTEAPSGIASIPVIINGSPRKLSFDTAGGRSFLSEGAVDSLGLHAVSSNVKLLDRSGNASQRSVTIDSLIIGGMEAKGVVFQISPDPNFGGNPNLPVDGSLASDIMENYDADLDFAGGKVIYFSPDHCAGHVVHWTSAPASAVAFTRGQPGVMGSRDTHIRFHVMLDGKDVSATLSTGSPRTQMSARTASANFDVKEDTPGTTPLGNMGGRKVFGYVFKTIAFGDVTVTNPHVVVLPDMVGRNDPNNAGRTDSRIGRVDDNIVVPDVTIGMDVIKKLHIYVATKEQKLYITAAQPAAGPGQPGPSPSP
jgi:predicted aspartyl protease